MKMMMPEEITDLFVLLIKLAFFALMVLGAIRALFYERVDDTSTLPNVCTKTEDLK